MESKFFGPSDSSSDVSDEEQTDEIIQQPKPALKSAFAFSDDEDEPKRIVRSEKDKRFDEMYEIIRVMKNHKKINDMGNIITDFENFVKAFEKSKKVIIAEGIPRFYIRTITELEDYTNQIWGDTETRKNMSKNNAKGLTSLRQKVRKYNKDFEVEITKYRESPDHEDEEAERSLDKDSSDDSEDEGKKKESKPKVDPKSFLKAAADEDDDDSDDWSSSSTDDDESEEEAVTTGNIAHRFLKKTVEGEKKKVKVKKEKKDKIKKDIDVDLDDEEWEEVRGGGVPTIGRGKQRMFTKDVDINAENVTKKLYEIRASRGKRGTDRRLQIELLAELDTIARSNKVGDGVAVKIHLETISAIFDVVADISTSLKPEYWEKVLENISKLLDLLCERDDITLSPNVVEDDEQIEEPPFRLHGDMLTLIERMDDEFTKILQNCDAHSTEYIDRLRDERQVCKIIEQMQAHCETRKVPSSQLCRIYFRRLSHAFYKFNPAFLDKETDKTTFGSKFLSKDTKPDSDTRNKRGPKDKNLVDQLCMFIYSKSEMDPLRTQAILYQIYHHSLHDRWYKARDLMQMSHLQDSIGLADIPLQIRFNRSLVQLGLCAFRAGFVKDAHDLLADIQSIGKAKELLAQGLLIQKHNERTPEQEKKEKQRLLPYHMHINLELMECVYLVSAMLIEIPIMAANEYEPRRRMISRNFYHVMRMSERQMLTGPPESMREHIVAASKAMKRGDWQACMRYIINDKMKSKVWNLFHKADVICDMISRKIQEESLRTYMFTYSAIYNTISISKLADMFELPANVAHSIISKMIINEELMASLDEPTKMIILHRTEPSHLQALALQLSDKVTNLVDHNEKISENRQGGFYKGSQPYQRGDRGDQRDRGDQNWGGRRNNRNYQQRNY